MFLNKLSLIRVYEKIDKERDTVGSHMDADDLLKKVSSELNKYVIDKELHHTDDLIFCVALFAFRFVLDKIS